MSLYETQISRGNMLRISNSDMTPEEIIDFLEQGATYRSFADILYDIYEEPNLAEKLLDGLVSIKEELGEEVNLNSLKRNVVNWMRGNSVPQSREQLFRICFALELSEKDASKVLSRVAESGIHYRNPQELVYAFALRQGMSYGEAVRLNEKMAEIYEPIIHKAEKIRAKQWAKKEEAYLERRREAMKEYQWDRRQDRWSESYIGFLREDEDPVFPTQHVVKHFSDIRSVQDLQDFFLENSASLGNIHESAYEKFWKLLLILESPDDAIASEGGIGNYSIEDVAELYLRMNVPMGRELKNYDYLQKTIKKSWPGPTELQKMKTRKMDVSRKTLLLLFLITEDFLYSEDLKYSSQASRQGADFIYSEEESSEEALELMIRKLNLFMESYGMNPLDPGAPFDCLILYALAGEFGDDFLSDSFAAALKSLFANLE